MTGEYISLVCQSKSRKTWRGSIYHWCFKVDPDQWYILSHHVFQDLLWQTSDIYSPVMCFRIYFDRPVIYTPPSCVSGFTLTDQWYILPRHVFQDLLCQTSDIYSPSCVSGFTLTRNTWRGSIYHWSVKVNPETPDGRVYVTGLSK
jgi:hypothetical protein